MQKKDLDEWLSEWTFKNREKGRYTHSIHKYPAVFIPELADKIISMYSNEGDVVLDIFSGSGTSVLESIVNKRIGMGIELNPLAYFISRFKIKPIDVNELGENIAELYDDFKNHHEFSIKSFDNDIFWFSEITLNSISKYLSYIERFSYDSYCFFKVCLSEIIRDISFCNHNGFKMHKDKNKESTSNYDDDKLLESLSSVISRNFKYVKSYRELIDSNSDYKRIIDKSCIYNHNTTMLHENIKPNSVDLIITSPPYGDSKTTVAYGQFSRLSMQIFGMDPVGDSKITQVDNELLGGKIKGIDPFDYSTKSLTLQNIQELFISRASLCEDKKGKKRHLDRLKDILSFYTDLDLAIKNASVYLKKDKYFVLITASRVVHNTKLHTDQIISELSYGYGFKLKNIHYRDIHNKRMPSRVSATNVVGETAPTMTEESIIVFKKIK
ncbi:DNA methyltransferase [Vibrio splendidus]|uniref:Methyltransferase n=1 Tax=Vibrio splendidus TaxID=29497 RepID=A0A2N7K164_VIBSP|nr:DNA methyltransferase [Vibrio splendidus]PMM66928.1 hypothetical protein BCT54_00355 [Vibrio splendidus]